MALRTQPPRTAFRSTTAGFVRLRLHVLLSSSLVFAVACSAYKPIGDMQVEGTGDDGETEGKVTAKKDAGARNSGDSNTSPTPSSTVSVAPRITTMNPATAVAGSRGLSLTIFGVGFSAASTVDIRGTSISATLEASGSLRVTLPDALLATSGSLPVVVKTGGLVSDASTFVVSSPAAATLTSLTPSTAPARRDGSTVALRVDGSGFVSTSQIVFGGRALPTTFSSATSLSATIPSDLLIVATTHSVAVRDGAIGPMSAGLNFQVTPGATGTGGTSGTAGTGGTGTCGGQGTRNGCLVSGCGWIEPAGPCINADGSGGGGGGGGGTGCGANATRTGCLNAGCGWIESNGPCIDPNGGGGGGGGGGGVCGGNASRSGCLNAGCGWIEPAGPCIE